MSFRLEGSRAIGTPSLGIGAAEEAAVLKSLLLAARRARPKLLSAGITLDENRITVQIFNEMRKVQRDLGLTTFQFHPESFIADRSGRIAKIAGRIDFKVQFRRQTGDYDDYYGIECKRVDAGKPDLLRYFVSTGIGKFASETYGAGHPVGMLVGYVMAPTAAAAMDAIRRKIAASKHDCGPWRDHPARYRDAVLCETDLRRLSGTSIRLLHTLVRMH